MEHVRRHLPPILLWLGVPILLWYTTRAPFGWIALWLAALLMVTGVRRKRAVVFNLAWLFVLIGGTEIILWAAAPDTGRVIPGNFQKAYSGPHDVLGYAPIADHAGRARRVLDGETIYDVQYTIGPHGWRVMPPVGDPPPEAAVLCFGCSFMFGEGMPDDAAMAWVLGEQLADSHRVWNFAFQGWGPHQMLAALASSIVADTIEGRPTHAFFLTSAGHAARAAGRRRWDTRGPRYAVQPGGGVTQVGTFADLPQETYWERRWRKFRDKSWLVRTLRGQPWQGALPEDIDLWVGITRQAAGQIETTWPGSRLHVLLWDTSPEADAAYARRLREAGVTVHRMSAVLEGLDEDWSRWALDPYDPHPSREAHAKVAAFMASIVRGAAGG